MDLDELRATTSQLLDLAGARARESVAPVPQRRRRRRRAKEPFGVTVRVDLVGAKPPVWRRLVLPSTLRLDQLHGVLQAVFDWMDSRLHRFSLDDEAWGDGERYLCPYDVGEREDDGVPASDMGWTRCSPRRGRADLPVRLRRRLAPPAGRRAGRAGGRRTAADGHGAAPPEHSGGIWDWDADAAPPLDLAEAQAALAVRELLDAAGLDQPMAVDDDVAQTATARHRWLLHRVGAGVAASWVTGGARHPLRRAPQPGRAHARACRAGLGALTGHPP